MRGKRNRILHMMSEWIIYGKYWQHVRRPARIDQVSFDYHRSENSREHLRNNIYVQNLIKLTTVRHFFLSYIPVCIMYLLVKASNSTLVPSTLVYKHMQMNKTNDTHLYVYMPKDQKHSYDYRHAHHRSLAKET